MLELDDTADPVAPFASIRYTRHDGPTSYGADNVTTWNAFRDAVRGGMDPDRAAILAGLPVMGVN